MGNRTTRGEGADVLGPPSVCHIPPPLLHCDAIHHLASAALLPPSFVNLSPLPCADDREPQPRTAVENVTSRRSGSGGENGNVDRHGMEMH